VESKNFFLLDVLKDMPHILASVILQNITEMSSQNQNHHHCGGDLCQERPGFPRDPHHPIIEHMTGDIYHRGASAKTNSHIAQPWENSALNTTTRFNQCA
jgi:hypothetical protein